MIAHEEEARKVHQSARNFKPVKAGPFGGILIGWTFEVAAKEGAASIKHCWVTNRNEVSVDMLDLESHAVRNLRAFVRNRPPKV